MAGRHRIPRRRAELREAVRALNAALVRERDLVARLERRLDEVSSAAAGEAARQQYRLVRETLDRELRARAEAQPQGDHAALEAEVAALTQRLADAQRTIELLVSRLLDAPDTAGTAVAPIEPDVVTPATGDDGPEARTLQFPLRRETS